MYIFIFIRINCSCKTRNKKNKSKRKTQHHNLSDAYWLWTMEMQSGNKTCAYYWLLVDCLSIDKLCWTLLSWMGTVTVMHPAFWRYINRLFADLSALLTFSLICFLTFPVLWEHSIAPQCCFHLSYCLSERLFSVLSFIVGRWYWYVCWFYMHFLMRINNNNNRPILFPGWML